MRSISTCAVVFCVLCAAGSAVAQTDRFDVQQFNPQPSQTTNYITVASPQLLRHLGFEAGILANYADSPLVLVDGDDERQLEIVSSQLTLDLLFAFALFDRVQVGVDIPLVVLQNGDESGEAALDASEASFGLGDIRVVPTVQLLDTRGDGGGFLLGLLVDLQLPTGDDASFQGEGGFRAEPGVALEYVLDGGSRIGANLGFQIRPAGEYENVEIANNLSWGLAADVLIGESFHIIPEVTGAYSLGVDDLAAEETPIEALLGLRYFVSPSFMLEAGFGTGLVRGAGTPDWRAFFGLAFAPADDGDRDNDGIPDELDACPDDPEDFDNFRDEDGCPDPDNDGDRIPDVRDLCPDIPENYNNVDDHDGCPDADGDRDRDGIPDLSDQCPDHPEDVDGFQDSDGCPDPDNDQDRILDIYDGAPMDPEDHDGFEDTDGIPDPDNDRDGFLDVNDQCPMEPETRNGVDDDDGCPDDGGLVTVTCERIEISDSIYFRTGSAEIRDRSFELLNTVAAAVRAAPYIRRLRVEGHTDDRGSDSYNLDLSQRRAESVMDFLIDAGVEEVRLESQGFGETRPIADNGSSDGRQQNRRVDFVIVEADQCF